MIKYYTRHSSTTPIRLCFFKAFKSSVGLGFEHYLLISLVAHITERI